ncbi:hypothetical protein EX30DRAFT_364039 [Ascodesmis nigricans]|uniref:Uncharacterized protein n=1 Tax=Ascodesmis nigricans TaxID=341454 RepID=A0A4S2MWQ7_9PEZI|nr:hypothetical protein EX30DRAFT_364039 [Ascodesmis nigricans]
MVELLQMRNEISDMFNERKMQGRAEMRGMENKIVELNYKITIMLGSEVRSEIEKLRWVTTRRGLAAIGALATVVFICLRMNGSNKKKKEADASSASSTSTSPPAPPPAPTSGHLFEIQQSPASQ